MLMAAGAAVRFGGGKLEAELSGRPLYARALDAVPPGLRTVVVTGSDPIAAAALSRGFSVCRNDRPEDGVSRTIRLGTEALRDCEAILYLVADQPLLTRESVCRVLALARRCPGCICCAAADGRRGNPCLFPRAFFPELLSLSGDQGGSAVIRRHGDLLRLAEIPPRELLDIDTADALRILKEEAT